jgi:RNA polymerase sigma factor (sigma-70 family)
LTSTTKSPQFTPPPVRAGDAVLATSRLSELVHEAREGNVAAWSAIVDRFAGLVWAVTRRHGLSKSDAADVSQTTWLRLVEHIDRIEDPERIAGWLATTARHESLRVLRASDRCISSEHDEAFNLRFVDSVDVGESLLIDERDRELFRLVSMLSPRCQLLLSVFGAESRLSYVEISEILGMPVGGIGPTRGRCLEHLRRLAADRGILTTSGMS